MARLSRLKDPNHLWKRHRKALPTLLAETQDRCAYSFVHVAECGDTTMEVDHINPLPPRGKKKDNRHGNLLSAHGHCNSHKGQFAPSARQKKRGLYVINPYAEVDYGVHLAENPETGELVGLTCTGRFHLRRLDLNAPFLVRKRRRRTMLRMLLVAGAFHAAVGPLREKKGTEYAELLEGLAKDLMGLAIPPIAAVEDLE